MYESLDGHAFIKTRKYNRVIWKYEDTTLLLTKIMLEKAFTEQTILPAK